MSLVGSAEWLSIKYTVLSTGTGTGTGAGISCGQCRVESEKYESELLLPPISGYFVLSIS